MNYSTLKKTAALSFASLMVVGLASAQTMTTDTTMKMSSGMTTAKVFGGSNQYNRFSFGINGGVTAPVNASGGSNDFTNWNASYGYGASLRLQVAHSFGIEGDFNGGKLKGNNKDALGGFRDNLRSFSTNFFSATLSGVVNVATVDYLHRKNAINFYLKGGAGVVWYHPTLTNAAGAVSSYKNADGSNHYPQSLVIPVGAGVKFRLTDALALNVGYTENFIDDDILDGLKRGYPSKDKYSYGYGGLEYTFGSKSRSNLDWVNPVAMMYDELYDAALRQEVEALKGRVTNVENAVNDLKKDSDGDGVSDQFDKCPNTPAGTVVDGSGCPLKKDTVMMGGQAMAPAMAAYSNIMFDFDSSVLRTSSYPTLDAVSADLRAMTAKKAEVDGYASSEGTAAHNMTLSKDRANSVKTYLVNSGVDAKRLMVKAYGETHPIADNSTEEGRVQNRRVEFKQK